MKKLTFQAVVTVIGVTLTATATVGFLARGYIREDIIPGYVSLTQRQALAESAEIERQQLQDPFSLLGYRNSPVTERCALSSARFFSTTVTCEYSVDGSTPVAQGDVRGTQLLQAGETLQTLLQQNGWNGPYDTSDPSTSISEFITAVAQDRDDVSDATYQKNIGDYDCTFSTVTASSSPAPVAIASHYTCSGTFTLF